MPPKLLCARSGLRPGRATCPCVGYAESEPPSRRAAGQRALLQERAPARAPSAGAPGEPARPPGADGGQQSACITSTLGAFYGAVTAGPHLILSGTSRCAPDADERMGLSAAALERARGCLLQPLAAAAPDTALQARTACVSGQAPMQPGRSQAWS